MWLSVELVIIVCELSCVAVVNTSAVSDMCRVTCHDVES